MAADLRFVVHAAQRQAHELAAQRLRDALAERRLAHAGRTYEAQDRALAVRIELAHREVLEDAPLHLLEPEMIGIEDAARFGDLDRLVGWIGPGKLDQPAQVRAHHRVLGRGLRHLLEAPQLLARLLLDLLGHVRLVDLLGKLLHLRRVAFAFAQLLLDRLELLAQQHFALALLEPTLRLLADLARQAQHLDAAHHELQHGVQTLAHVQRLEDVLLLGRLDVEQARDEIGQRAGCRDLLHRGGELRRNTWRELEQLRRARLHLQHVRFDLLRDLGGIGQELHACDLERQALVVAGDAEALLAMHDELVRAVGRRDVTQDGGRGADRIEIALRRILGVRMPLQQHADAPLGAHGFLSRSHRRGARHRKRCDQPREQDDVAHRHDDQGIGRHVVHRALRGRLALGVGAHFHVSIVGHGVRRAVAAAG
jgi:hypothetical protein